MNNNQILFIKLNPPDCIFSLFDIKKGLIIKKHKVNFKNINFVSETPNRLINLIDNKILLINPIDNSIYFYNAYTFELEKKIDINIKEWKMIKPLFLSEINNATAGAPALDLMEKYFETYSNTRILGNLKNDLYYLLYLQPDSTSPALKVPKEVFFKLNKNADFVEINNGISYLNLTNRDSVLNKNNYPFCTISSKSAGNIVFENDKIYFFKWSSNINPFGLSMKDYYKKENTYFSENEPILRVFVFKVTEERD